MKKQPKLAVAALIKNKDGKFLFVKTHKLKDIYTIPGGGIKPGESPEEALKREVKEEVGLEIKKAKLFKIQESMETDEPEQAIFFNYLCDVDNDKVKIDNYEILDFTWVKPSKSLNLKLHDEVRKIVEEVLEQK